MGGGGAVKRLKARQAEFYLFSILVSLSRSYEVVTFYSKDQFIRKNVPAPNFVKTFGVKIFEKKCWDKNVKQAVAKRKKLKVSRK